ncbi:hypothetical protein [Phocaeicola plebeius]|jgi:hypothetical protein|uniref:hypothetical protein n=1 Tax=Phocaeicola plebeius TaxID=310297 RepID=UPI0026F26269|nr:hypothetical protein [Phocaeicola plebeius]
MKTKKRFVDIVSPALRYAESINKTSFVAFKDVLSFMNNKEYRYNEKIFELRLLDTTLNDCILGIIETTQDSDIPPIKNKTTKKYSSVEINPETEGLAYANIFIYDSLRNIFIFEINRNGCFLNQFIDFIYSKWNASEENIPFDLKFAAVLRANEYQRMLDMDYYKRITVDLYNPVELINCFNEANDSLANNLLRTQIQAGQQNNANILRLEHIAMGKRINPMGLSRSLVKGVVDAVKVSIADSGHRQNIQKIEVLGYSVDIDSGKSTSKTIDILADTFNESFKIPDVQIQSNIQLEDRKQGIETLYSKVLPEIRTIIGW